MQENNTECPEQPQNETKTFESKHLNLTHSDIEARLNELEIKLIFQDDLLNTLNDIVTRQDQEIMKLWDANRLLKQSMQDIKEGGKEEFVDVPPPHY